MDSKRGGGGEPGRTSSGRVRTRLQQHPETRFQEHATNDLLPASVRHLKTIEPLAVIINLSNFSNFWNLDYSITHR